MNPLHFTKYFIKFGKQYGIRIISVKIMVADLRSLMMVVHVSRDDLRRSSRYFYNILS